MSDPRALTTSEAVDEIVRLLDAPRADEIASPELVVIPPPSVLDIVRCCPPSAELVDLLAKLSLEHTEKGQHDLAAELLAIALCARSARRANWPLG